MRPDGKPSGLEHCVWFVARRIGEGCDARCQHHMSWRLLGLLSEPLRGRARESSETPKTPKSLRSARQYELPPQSATLVKCPPDDSFLDSFAQVYRRICRSDRLAFGARSSYSCAESRTTDSNAITSISNPLGFDELAPVSLEGTGAFPVVNGFGSRDDRLRDPVSSNKSSWR